VETVDNLLKTTYTYTITNTILETIVYVGKSTNPQKRWAVHKSCVKSAGKANQKFVMKKIHYHMAEFGIENFVFSIFADCDCEAQLQEQINPLCNIKKEKIL